MPKKILFIVDQLACGGADKVTLELADYLAQKGLFISIAVLNGQYNFIQVPDSIHYVDLQFRREFAFGKLWKNKSLNQAEQNTLVQLLKKHQFDAIILGYNNGHWLKPYISGNNTWHWIHADLIAKRPSRHLLSAWRESWRVIRHTHQFKKLLNHCNIIIVNANLIKKYTPLLSHSNFYLLQNGINQSKLFATLNHKSLHQRDAKPWQVVFVGRLDKNKQVDHALKAFSKSGLTGKMLIVGDGAARQALECLSQSLNIQDRVEFMGTVAEPAQLIRQSHCLVLSSFSEGAPLCIAEALSLGTPVVAYACSEGIMQQLEAPHLQIGLVPPQDIQQLAQRLHDVVNIPYQILECDKRKLSIETMAASFLTLIDNT